MRILIDLQGAQSDSRFRGIGRYSLSLALAMARNARSHEIWIALNAALPESIPSIRQAFAEWVPPERICLFEAPHPTEESCSANAWRTRVAELVREHFLEQLQPDVIFVSSLFEGFANQATTSVGQLTSGSKTAVTLYDLIPLLSPEVYLHDDDARAYYYRKIDSLQQAGLLLAISEYSRREAIEALGFAEDRIVTISTAVDERFRPLSLSDRTVDTLRRRYGIERKMVLYAPGGFDSRKNFAALIGAYATLAPELRDTHQLVIVSRIESDNVRFYLQKLADDAGLRQDELIRTDYVPDEDLVALYNLATLFVFPSLHEGFGLPVLEAMACGAPTIGSNTTSIPEVIGLEEALFDPASPASIAEKMARALSDESWRQKLREHGLQQAKKFSWDVCAQAAIAAFEARWRAPHSRRDLPLAPRRLTVDAYRRSCQDLATAIAALPPSLPAPDENDRQLLTVALANNFKQLERLPRSTILPERLTWRIEGPFDSSYSLALLNRETALALDELGHEVVLHSTEGPGDFPPNEAFLLAHPALARLHRKAAEISPETADVTSRNLYPPRVADMTCRINFLHHYAWEESGFPQQWVTRFNEHLQGITCLSRHVQKIMVDNGVSVPMMTSGCGVDHCDRFDVDPEFRIEARAFRFLHVSSCFPRKGADVLLKAYGQAFSAADPVTLVIKTFPNPHNEIRQWLASAQKTTPHYPDVLLIEEDLSDAQLKAVYQQCHALVAPSRAEGFGLPMAEAMLCGLPVITTGWGGQLDFCTPDTAWLVDFMFAPAETHFGLFDSVWAEPSAKHLAQIMRDVYALPPEIRREKSNAGRELLLRRFKWKDVTARLVTAARNAATISAPPTPRIGWVSTWDTPCGIAAYSAHLVGNLPAEVTILAPDEMTEDVTKKVSEKVTENQLDVLRCWKIGEEDALDRLSQTIEERGIDSVVIQFNYGFFNFAHFSRFLTAQANSGKVVVVVMHATADPSHVPEKRLFQLAEALSRCQRVLVHSPNDLNRLKTIGLVDNVTIFPHGVVDHPMTPRRGSTALFTIASYGFFLPHKGLLELIEALALLVAEGRAVCLKMINAAYPIPESATLIESARKMVAQRGLAHAVQIVADFLPDAESLNQLSAADLIVFPYQDTSESSSAAVRYGLATGRPVAVTPLAIFDEVSRAVFKLPGKSPVEIARGIGQLMDNILSNDERIIEKLSEAHRWREEHRHFRLGLRLHGLLSALLRTRALGKTAGSREEIFRSTLFRRLAALQQRAIAAEFCASEQKYRALAAESKTKEEAQHVQMAKSSASEQEQRAVAAESRAAEQEQRAVAAESRASEQSHRVFAAESRASEQSHRAFAAESRASEQEQRAFAAESRASEQEQRAFAAESRASEQEQRAVAAESRASEQEQRAVAAESRASEQEQRAVAAESRASEQEQRAVAAESRVAALLKSWSWRSTAPMRGAVSAVYSFTYWAVTSRRLWTQTLPKIFAKLGGAFLRRYPVLSSRISQRLLRYPALHQKLLDVVLRDSTLSAEEPQITLETTAPPISLEGFSPRTCKIYADIKGAIETAAGTKTGKTEAASTDALTPKTSAQKWGKS